jgi:thiol-disulfide isomerase/thioredoxin
MAKIVTGVIALSLFFAACQQPPAQVEQKGPANGLWRMALDLDTTAAVLELPFQFDFDRHGNDVRLVIHNQDEAIPVDSVTITGDSIRIRMPFFDSEFRGTFLSPDTMKGFWYNRYKGPNYAIPFTAVHGDLPRFRQVAATPAADISGDWEVHFIDGQEDEPAIGIFTVKDGRVKGSFATETGDLRFLEGVTTRDSLFLSSFNGSQAFLFRAAIHGDSLLGEFRSGHRWKQPWIAVRNPQFALANDETLTKLDPAHPVAFSFPDVDGRMHALTDAKYQGRVVALEIMGTWCPNCLDQSRLMNELYKKYNKDGLEVVALSFERYPDPEAARKAIRHFEKTLGIGYDMLYGGVSVRDSVEKKLPFLQQLMSYPTTLLIGRDGKVHRTITGIYGPGTGDRYTRFRERMENSIVELLREPAKS